MTTVSSRCDVSVMIAAWKSEDFIHTAISSALSQAGVDVEVIVVDDCSPDNTVEAALAAGAGDPRLRVVRQSVNGGPSVARNRALDMANGRFVAVLDADDHLMPGRLAQLVETGDTVSADIIIDNMVRVNAAGDHLDEGAFLDGEDWSSRRSLGLAEYLSGNVFMSGGRALGYLKPLFRTETLRRLGLRYEPDLRNSEDYYLVADLLAQGATMVFEPIEGYAYRVDAGSISHRLRPELTSALVKAEAAFQLRHQGRLDPTLQGALRRRLDRLRHAHAYVELIDLIKARKPAAIVQLIAANLSATGFFVTQLGAAARQKLAPA